jgi:hypothetical protein
MRWRSSDGMSAMSHVLFDLPFGSARFLPIRRLSAARLLANHWCRQVTSGWRAAGGAGLLRAGQALASTPMVMTAAFGGRTYTRPVSGETRVRGW